MATVSKYAQFEVNPYPGNLQSGWLPPYGSDSMQAYFDRILNTERTTFAPSVRALASFIAEDAVVKYLVGNACDENLSIIDSHLPSAQGGGNPAHQGRRRAVARF